jgi:ubiquinone/menaquinone biosynthesis C-methylase UbiE
MTIDSGQSTGKLADARLRQYWAQLSEQHLSVTDDGLAAICYAGMPAWFNRFLDHYQRKAMDRLLTDQRFEGARVLDVGTGVGRWARWFVGRGAGEVVGIDLEDLRLTQARAYGGPVSYLRMSTDDLAFPDASFDVVNSITVLQHVPDETKRRALAEFARVLKPGGRAVLFEVSGSHDDAAHVFPWTRQQWESAFAEHGLALRASVGDQYTPLLRLLKAAFTLWKGARSRTEIALMKDDYVSAPRWQTKALHAAVVASYPVEELARFLPSGFARITGFLLQKD